MRRIWKILLSIFVIFIIFFLAFFMFKVFSKQNTNSLDQKVTSEIQYLEKNFMNIFNELNNITFENYSLDITSSKENTSNSSENQSESQNQSESSSNSGSGGSGSKGESKSQSSTEPTSEYQMKQSGILTATNDNINWTNIKNEVEHIYTSISTITLDMYSLGVNHDEILGFNSDFDTLTTSIKNENKQDTLNTLVQLYNFLPIFLKEFSKDTDFINIVSTKYNIFYSYSLLDTDDWTTIDEHSTLAIEEFSKVLNNITENKNRKETKINQIYIELNEMKNAITIKDKEIYLIKYKNILEDLNSL